MLSRRTLLTASAAGLAAPALPRSGLIGSAEAATPKNAVVMAKTIDDIVGGFDPAQSYEFADNEGCGNIYRKLVAPDPQDNTKLVGDLAEKWEVTPDGLNFTFHIRKGVLFDSGKPVTAEDVAFSLQRVVKLNLTPGFILTQFGWTADNVEKMIHATDDHNLALTLPAVQATSFVLYCLSATVGCVVEKARVMANQKDGDLGNNWLKTHSAGAGPYRLVEWVASDHIIYDANPHAAEKPKVGRIVIRHVAEPSTQLLMLQKGDIDMARDLTADQLKTIDGKPDYNIARRGQLTQMYIGMNKATPEFSKVEVLQALKWAVAYEAIAKNITPGMWFVWQSVLPKGSPGAIDDMPFKKDVAKAKDMLAKAGYPNGFTVTMDHFAQAPYSDIAQAIQADFAAVGVKVNLQAAEKKQVYGKMRARQHQMVLSSWFPDYLDANSNAQAFCADPDDSDNSKLRILAWRNHFYDPEMTAMVEAAVKELDNKKRDEIYAKMQRDFLQKAPFIMMLQQNEVDAMPKGVSGIQIGVLPDYTRYAQITKA
ncbi:MAG: ABC transporter substrate-binding protein [Rhodospirillales bacterium]|nr:ABC transporter substrate-binding protein [Rhodospirillales bacterium]